jgi:hypothetical protein
MWKEYRDSKGTASRTYVLRKIWAERGAQGLAIISGWLQTTPEDLACEGGFIAKWNRTAWGSKASARGRLPCTGKYGEGACAPGAEPDENLHQRSQPELRDPAIVEIVSRAAQTLINNNITPQTIYQKDGLPLPRSLKKVSPKPIKFPIITIALTPDSEGKYEHAAIPDPIPDPTRIAISKKGV